MFNRYTTEV